MRPAYSMDGRAHVHAGTDAPALSLCCARGLGLAGGVKVDSLNVRERVQQCSVIVNKVADGRQDIWSSFPSQETFPAVSWLMRETLRCKQ